MKMKDALIFQYKLEGMKGSHMDAIERLSQKDICGFVAFVRGPEIRDGFAQNMCRGLDDESECIKKVGYVFDKQNVELEKVLKRICKI